MGVSTCLRLTPTRHVLALCLPLVLLRALRSVNALCLRSGLLRLHPAAMFLLLCPVDFFDNPTFCSFLGIALSLWIYTLEYWAPTTTAQKKKRNLKVGYNIQINNVSCNCNHCKDVLPEKKS